MATYVLVHGAWHTGTHFKAIAATIRAQGHTTHTPTIAGNGPDDSRRTGLKEAIDSICLYLTQNELTDVILLGHSYGGMVITGVADALPDRIRRLVYWNAFVPNNGESLNDMVPEQFVGLFDSIAGPSDDNSVVLPFPIWREAFFNDGSAEHAQEVYSTLNPHPYQTFTDSISLGTNPAEMTIPKSYINGTEDTAMPQSLGWHPRLSEKLGLFRLVQTPGGHELCFTNPDGLAAAILLASRD